MPTHSGSLKVFLMCSPRPYRLGFFGRAVLISKYWSENCTAVERGERERERERERANFQNSLCGVAMFGKEGLGTRLQ